MEEIIKLRSYINEIDEKILDLIIERISLSKEIGVIKKQNGIEIIDKEREEEIMKKLESMANVKGMNPDTIKKIWVILIKASYEVEG